jgi:hypothetical protein
MLWLTWHLSWSSVIVMDPYIDLVGCSERKDVLKLESAGWLSLGIALVSTWWFEVRTLGLKLSKTVANLLRDINRTTTRLRLVVARIIPMHGRSTIGRDEDCVRCSGNTAEKHTSDRMTKSREQS